MLPTYSYCKKICEESNGIFYESQTTLDGYKVSIFNYRYASYVDFMKYGAFELRGLCFVFDQDGSNFNTYPLFEKFFNINENDSTSIEIIKSKEIKSIFIKEDGSIIGFVKLPNGKIYARSKTSFISEQSILSQTLLESNSEIKIFVESLLDIGLNPIFELVGPKNKIVVDYKKTELILLGIRDNIGNYVELSDVEFKKPEKVNYTLQEIISMKSSSEGVEGWIVTFMDGQRVKIKTDWYFSLHRILTDYTERENVLIKLILDEKIDDVLSVLDIGSESRQFVESIQKKTLEKLEQINKSLKKLLSEYEGDKKSFAIKNNKNEYFKLCMCVINGRDLNDSIKDFVQQKTKRLFAARDWLDL